MLPFVNRTVRFLHSVCLWCVLQLLVVSKTIENISGSKNAAEEPSGSSNSEGEENCSTDYEIENNELPTNNIKTIQNSEIEDPILTLSKPVGQLIEETFLAEVSKIENQQLFHPEVLAAESIFKTFNSSLEDNSSATSSDSEESIEKIFYQEETIFDKEPTMTKDNNFKTQIRVLTLNDKEHQDSTLYRLEKNWILQFRLGPSLLGRRVQLSCNYPENPKAEFNRNCYRVLQWCVDEGCSNTDDTSAYCEILIHRAGSFHYFFTHDIDNHLSPQGSGFFIVDPALQYGENETLHLDCIQCQTVLAKGLGKLSTWENKLRVAKESGYNMIHFTPIQELGGSNSSYSLSEQLKLNPIFDDDGKKATFDQVEALVAKIRRDWRVTSICDIVLNHTANESKWLLDHPEATYNCANCTHLRPAYLVDAAFHQLTVNTHLGLYESKGIPRQVNSEDHLNAIRHVMNTEILPSVNIGEMFTCDVSSLVSEFLTLARNRVPLVAESVSRSEELRLNQDPEYRRLTTTVDLELALRLYNIYRPDCFDEESRLRRCTEEFKHKLELLNLHVYEELNDHLKAAIENSIAGIRYFRIQGDGPRIKEVSIKQPLVPRYFTDYGNPKSLKEFEEVMFSSNGKYLMAHNGWVMNSDPLQNFAAIGSNVYIRRELIAWGDSVKLRYGDKPEDSPFLWNHMKIYVEQTAKIFDGIRLDNCHSTPIPVAEYLLDCARKIRPDLYVVAELFTNSDQKDNIFVNRLGINSLIREAMSAWDSHELGRLVYRYGGVPVGAFQQPNTRPLVPSIAHALFLDLTHDNPSPVEKRSVFDLLPSAALVNMACCASGSNRGYDELVPHHIHVVDETRQYTEWSDYDSQSPQYVSSNSGIIAAKRALNEIHLQLGCDGFDQVYVDQMDGDIVAVTRHCPKTHQSVILVAFTAFSHPNHDAGNYQRGIKPLRVEGVLEEIVLEASLSHIGVKSGGSRYADEKDFAKDEKWINGLSEYQVSVKRHIQMQQSDIFELGNSGDSNVVQLNFKNFKPGSIAIIRVSLPLNAQKAVRNINALTNTLSPTANSELNKLINNLTLADLNRILYRCDEEEKDEGKGFGAYNIPNFGNTVYCGFQGYVSLLAQIRPSNDLGHPMCCNLRDGNWMIDYMWQRLQVDEGTRDFAEWLESNTDSLKNLPRYLVPCYFDVVVTGIYVLLLEKCFNSMGTFVKSGSTFVRSLALGSVQCSGVIHSASLPKLSPNLAPPAPPKKLNFKGELVQSTVTLSAGLPHFTVGYMRSWGRDTFIALRGLLILTERHQDARYHILGYAACLRHGLIPNLLDGGKNARFNCRDAVWWWLHSIKSYVEEVPNGVAILSDKVSRIYPTDESPAVDVGIVDQPLRDVIQEALTAHFQGMKFRERNAGRAIDAHMSDRGFNNQVGVHPDTGFVFGGNEWNCGTWMDKMGSSDKAGNRGKPATPRDGSAVEIIGLSKAVLSWLARLHEDQLFPYEGVERYGNVKGAKIIWTYNQWADKIKENFEHYFWINTTPSKNEFKPELVHQRGIYKDSFSASQQWADYQLRCNFPIAMVVAPELFTPSNAWTALNKVEEKLLGPLGIKTLDPDDWAYCGDYDNTNDSNEGKVAHGFNYHQGPEWVWPVGYFLRAKLRFAEEVGELPKTICSVKSILSRHFTELQTSPWRGLPELTNSSGSYCQGSCRSQAWSMSCILEVLRDLQKLEEKQPIILN